jgi:hypothetical protein
VKQGIQEYLPVTREVDLTNPVLKTKGIIVKGEKIVKPVKTKQNKAKC